MTLLKDTYRTLRRLARAVRGDDVLQFAQEKLPVARHGSDYGGWAVYPAPLRATSVIYSFGVGEDISFDRSLIDTYGLQVHAFDPTPKSIAWIARQDLPGGFHFHDFGIADYDGVAAFAAPRNPAHVSFTLTQAPAQAGTDTVQGQVFQLGTIMEKLGHTQIDLLKMDIEGAEYAVIENLLTSGVAVEQILVEFHHRFPHVPVDQTRAAIARLNEHGYRIFHVSATGEEYAFIKRA